MEWGTAALARATFRDALVDAAVDLALQALDEALDQVVVVPGAELAARRKRCFELLLRLPLHPATVLQGGSRLKVGRGFKDLL